MHLKRLLIGKRRQTGDNKALGIHLAFIAGAINAGGFMVVGQYTSHMTGVVSVAADLLALGQWLSASLMLFYVMCFIAGSLLTTFIILWAKNRHLYSSYALPLLFEAFLLLCFALLNDKFIPEINISAQYIIALLCCIMGVQNAVITKISNFTIRTTHVTGMVTDIGIEAGRLAFSKEKEQRAIYRERLLLHIYMVLTFILGGVIGAYATIYIGFVCMLPIASYILLIAFFPIFHDIRLGKKLKRRINSL